MSKLDLEQQRKRAKDLVRAHRRGEPAAAQRFQRHLPRAGTLTLAQVHALELQLADAQLVVAREAGFASWTRLKRHVEGAQLDANAPPPLHLAVRAGNLAAVRAVLAGGVERWQTREAMEDAIERADLAIIGALLDHGSWVDYAGRRWGRWGGGLHTAILLGRDAALIELLCTRARIEQRDRDGRTALAIAVRTGHDAGAAVLRAHGANEAEVGDVDRALGAALRGERAAPPGALLRSDHQHLCWALRHGRGAAIPALLALGLDPTIADDDGDTPLHLAVAARDPAAIRALIAAGARGDQRDFRGETPLDRALREPDDAVLAALRAAGAPESDHADLAELFEDAVDAIVTGDLERLRGLLDREPRLVTARSLHEHQATLLHYSGANGVERQASPPNAPAIAQLLLDRGAEPNALARTYGGGPAQTPLYLAFTSTHPAEAGVMDELVRTLVRGGATLERHDRSGYEYAEPTAFPALIDAGLDIDLVLAATLGRLDDARRLVRADGTLAPGAKLGSDLPVPDREILDRALLAACRGGHAAIAELLLDAGASVDARTIEAMTPLHLVVWQAHVAVARLLIEHGAPLEARNGYGGTPLGFAIWVVKNAAHPGADYAALVALLLDAGADPSAIRIATTGDPAIDELLARVRVVHEGGVDPQ